MPAGLQLALMVQSGSCWHDTNSGIQGSSIFHPFVSLCFHCSTMVVGESIKSIDTFMVLITKILIIHIILCSSVIWPAGCMDHEQG